MRPPASIVISTRNRREDVLVAIESSLAQKYEPLEVIVYDDASTDGTAEAIQNRFPEVRLIASNVQQGYIAWRNRGFIDAGGEFIFSLDDDAYFTDPHTVTKAVGLFERHPKAAAIALPFIEPHGHGATARPVDAGAPLKCYVGCAHALRRDIALQLGRYREFLVHQGEERDLCLRMLEAGWGIIYGDSGAIVHLYSPKRDQARLSYYGFRNTLLISWLNIPQPYVIPRIIIDSAQLFRYRLTLTGVPSRLRVITAGWLACIKHWGDRRAVRRETYRRFRSLVGHGPQMFIPGQIPSAPQRESFELGRKSP